jgi:glycosyltransferase involved in cell wall biosynthesis
MKTPIRVLHVTSIDTDNYFLNNLVDETPRSEVVYSAVTFAGAGGFTRGLEQRGVPTYALSAVQRRQYGRGIPAFQRIIRKEKPDIIHTHLFDPTLIGVALAKLNLRRSIVTRHHSDALYQLADRVKRAGYHALESLINRAADHIIAPSQMVYEILTTRERVPASKVSIIPYGQKLERFAAVTSEHVQRARTEFAPRGEYLVVNVARLHPEKGQRYMFEAFKSFLSVEPKAKLVIVGDGSSEAELRAYVAKLGLTDRIHFALWRDDALAIIKAADLIVHPSLQEALPSAVIESLALERPIVATDVSGVRDLIGDSERGYVVPPADANALLRAMIEAHGGTEESKRRARLGREHVFASLPAALVANQHLECYRRVMER